MVIFMVTDDINSILSFILHIFPRNNFKKRKNEYWKLCSPPSMEIKDCILLELYYLGVEVCLDGQCTRMTIESWHKLWVMMIFAFVKKMMVETKMHTQ